MHALTDVLPVKKELAMSPQGLMMSDPFLTDSIHEVSNSDSVCDYMTRKTFLLKKTKGGNKAVEPGGYLAIELVVTDRAHVATMILIELIELVVHVQRTRDRFVEMEGELSA